MDRDTALELLDSPYTVAILIDVLRNPGISKSELLNLRTRGNRTRFNRIQELIGIGLISVKPSRHNTMHLYLTVEGQSIAVLLEKAVGELAEVQPPEKPSDPEKDL